MGCPWGQRGCAPGTPRDGESSRVQMRWANGPPVCHRVWDGLILRWGLPAPNPRGPVEWGVGAPDAENSPSLAPSQSGPGGVSSSPA